jgi:hypothetical protein
MTSPRQTLIRMGKPTTQNRKKKSVVREASPDSSSEYEPIELKDRLEKELSGRLASQLEIHSILLET